MFFSALVLAVVTAGQPAPAGQPASAGPEPGPDMVPVPAGEFTRGDDGGEPDERPRRRITLAAFALDRTEVTVGAYKQCMAAGSCEKRELPASARDATLPVTGVSWHDAARYCAFAGKRLPTEAEWEKAARGPDGRRYPWGDAFSCARGNFGTYGGDGRCAEEGASGAPRAVGSFPNGASPYGALDLAGNVWEWVADRYDAGYYRRAPARDPLGPPESSPPLSAPRPGQPEPRDLRVLRGGGCCSIFGLPRAADRLALPADYRDVDVGFRCARGAALDARPAQKR